jgi:hypothetical protein
MHPILREAEGAAVIHEAPRGPAAVTAAVTQEPQTAAVAVACAGQAPAMPSTPLVQQSFVDPYSDFSGPRFPLELLPPTLAEFVDAQHRAMGADPAAIAMAVLTAVAGSIHAETFIRVADGWREKPILWTALVGQPSTMKSPIIDKAVKPLSTIDHKQAKQWQREYALWQKSQQR